MSCYSLQLKTSQAERNRSHRQSLRFNGQTTVKYNLPNSITNAHMAVYDLTGKQLASFPITERGASSIITTEKLVAGIYIYSIVADGKVVDSKRMIVSEK